MAEGKLMAQSGKCIPWEFLTVSSPKEAGSSMCIKDHLRNTGNEACAGKYATVMIMLIPGLYHSDKHDLVPIHSSIFWAALDSYKHI